MTNPLLDWDVLPDFDAMRAEHILPATRQLVAEGEALLDTLESAPARWETIGAPLQAFEDRLGQVESIVRLLNAVRSQPDWRKAVKEMQRLTVGLRNRLHQSQPLYKALCALREQDLSPTQRRIVDSQIIDAERTGAQLAPAARQRLRQISEQLAELQLSFADNVLDSTKAWSMTITDPADIDGVPRRWRVSAAAAARDAGHDGATPEDGPWRLTLDGTSISPILSHATSRPLRETARRAWGQIATAAPHDNTVLVREILTLRAEKAALLGYANFPQQALASRMASSIDDIEQLMDTLAGSARDTALSERADLDAEAAASGHPTPLAVWDVGFWSERQREARYDLNDEALRPYFPLDNVLDALFGLCEELFGVRLQPAEPCPPTWHPDVRVYSVCAPDTGDVIATVYLDPYARPAEKRAGAWMSPLINRDRQQGRRPACSIACNLPRPTEEAPSLPGPRGARTLFHEFGHALHHMLTEADEVGAAGIRNVEWDAVELPSMFMENWLYHRPVLTQIARHYKTGEPLDDETIERLLDARRFRAGTRMLAQISYSLQDLKVHQHSATGDDPFAVASAVQDRISVLPTLETDRWLCSFQHIFAGGYAAGYYSYLWAEVLSADAFAAFEEADLDDPAARQRLGRRFRETVLALGGSQQPLDIFTAFRGRAPLPDALLRHRGLQSA